MRVAHPASTDPPSPVPYKTPFLAPSNPHSSRWVQNELLDGNGAPQLVQSTEVYEVAKEAHSGSEDDIDEDLADRMDMCEV